MKKIIMLLIFLCSVPGEGATLLQESFDNTSLPGAAYSTFDASIFDLSVRQGTSGYGVRWTWQTGEEEPDGVNTASRWLFSQTTDQLYLSFYWRLNSDWVGSGDSFHPHLIYITPELWTNLSGGDLRVYVELSNRQLRLIVGRTDIATFYDTGDSINLSEWSRIECWIVLNTIGQSNGTLKAWINGVEVYSNNSVLFRTDSSVHMGAIAIGPWISDAGVGSPQNQTMWMDSLIMSDEEPYASNHSTISGATLYGVSIR